MQGFPYNLLMKAAYLVVQGYAKGQAGLHAFDIPILFYRDLHTLVKEGNADFALALWETPS